TLKISGNSLRSTALLLCLAGALRAQQVVITGRVLYGPAGRPVARTWVVLHQVSMGGGGQAIDSIRSDARGAYALAIRRPDSAAIYVVSTWHAGIAYFSEPIAPGRSTSSLRPLYVYDTTSTGPAVRVTRRLVTVAKEQRDGSRDVLELVEPQDPGVATRGARDTVRLTAVRHARAGGGVGSRGPMVHPGRPAQGVEGGGGRSLRAGRAGYRGRGAGRRMRLGAAGDAAGRHAAHRVAPALVRGNPLSD